MAIPPLYNHHGSRHTVMASCQDGTLPPNAVSIRTLSSISHGGAGGGAQADDIDTDIDSSSEQADIPCQEVNKEDLISSLAALVGLHAGTVERVQRWLQNDIQYFITHNFDFGLAYAVAWRNYNVYKDCQDIDDVDNGISVQRGRWYWHAERLGRARSGAVYKRADTGEELIKSPYSIMPRRLWDLKSNRVVDFQMVHAAHISLQTKHDAIAGSYASPPRYWAISHSWTDPMKMPINHYQWHVPLPKGLDLNTQVQSELLSLRAEHVWLDLFCLRQQSTGESQGKLDQLKREEWKLDVPTIGNIYRAADRIVRYFNGLGITFSQDGWDDSRHWLQRAWTLQEITAEHMTINGGIPRGKRHQRRGFMDTVGKIDGNETTLRLALRPVLRLANVADNPRGCGLYELAREMTRRYASQQIDKLSGLFYLLRTTELPCYNEKMTFEDFWTASFHLLPLQRKLEALFEFPYRGSDRQWYKRFDFYSPYRSHDRINTMKPANTFTLVILGLGNEYNWIVCRPIKKKVVSSKSNEVVEANVLKKVGILRTDDPGRILISGENGGSMLKRIDCLIV